MSMTRIELVSRIGEDGILHLDLPLGPDAANTQCRVVVEQLTDIPKPAQPFADREEWLRFIEQTAGKWQGEFEIPDDPPPQERDLW